MSLPITYPAITLYNPWASWVIRGWKTIETRLHDKFRSLEGEWIAIHAGKKWDGGAIILESPWLTIDQVWETESFFAEENGRVLGLARVSQARWLTKEDSARAMIDCGDTRRFGLCFDKVVMWTPNEQRLVKGKQGIWYFSLKSGQEQQ